MYIHELWVAVNINRNSNQINLQKYIPSGQDYTPPNEIFLNIKNIFFAQHLMPIKKNDMQIPCHSQKSLVNVV